MQALDVIIRVAAATLLLALSWLSLRGARGERNARFLVPLALGLAGFLAGNTPEAALRLPGYSAALAGLLSGSAALFLWWFCLAAFDDDFRLGPLEWGVGGAWFALVLASRGFLGAGLAGIGLSWGLVGMAVLMVGHVAYRLLRDREGDLIEARRNARGALVAALVLLLLVDLGVDIVLGFDWKPQGFTVAQNAVILLLAAWLAGGLLRADAGMLAHRPAAQAPRSPSDAPLAQADQPRPAAEAPDERLLRRLDALMRVERIHRDPELTFAAFAARMGASEADVRRLVNRQLGSRHFRSFLNAYRVEEARAALADPARMDEKMVAIAFEAGFASLASFNRAFKLAEGVAPSEYRARMQAMAGDRQGPAEGAEIARNRF